MASEIIKKMLFQEMMKQGALNKEQAFAEERGNFVSNSFGSPAQQVPFQNDQTFPGEAPLKGLMTEEGASGMFDESKPMKQRTMEFNKAMMGSKFPTLQGQGFKSMMAENRNAGNPEEARTFAYGADDGQMQRGRIGSEGQLVPIGQPYDPRNPFLNTGTDFVNMNNPNKSIKINNEQKTKDVEEVKTDQIIERAANNKLLAVYGDEIEQSAKYKPAMDTVDRIIELNKTVETGKFVGSAPVVYLREMFGDTELQELNALIKGLPLPVLKATFGAAFSVKEGETLATSLANIGMDGPAFQKAMQRMKSKLNYDEKRFRAKERHFDKNKGNLMRYKDRIPYPKDLKRFDGNQPTPAQNAKLDDLLKKYGN